MKYRGINYDTGTKTTTGRLTRDQLDLSVVEKEIGIIKNELHCNSIRISGCIIERIVKSAEIALKLGLTVWFSPSLQYENQEKTLSFIREAASAAEKLRLNFPDIIFVAGCELSIFTSGFIKGETGNERLKNMFGPLSILKNMLDIKRKYNVLLNRFLENAVSEIKKQFRGKITYASGSWEKVNWDLFDFVGVDHYRSIYNKSIYIKELKNYKAFGKPVCIMEFGCCAYKGADDKGAMGWSIVDWKKDKPELKGDFIRDESVQSDYIIDLLNIFEKEEITAAFVFTFFTGNYIYNEDPKYDLDMASYGIVKSLGEGKTGYENLPWLPKKAFGELGTYYRNHSA